MRLASYVGLLAGSPVVGGSFLKAKILCFLANIDKRPHEIKRSAALLLLALFVLIVLEGKKV